MQGCGLRPVRSEWVRINCLAGIIKRSAQGAPILTRTIPVIIAKMNAIDGNPQDGAENRAARSQDDQIHSSSNAH